MTKFSTAFFASLLIALASLAVQAQRRPDRTWVSGLGDDHNPCSRPLPCKTFAGAIAKTAAVGEINVLTPGGYGAVVISKSITIDATGTFAGTLAASAAGITINITEVLDPARSSVRLRGLSINGLSTAPNGINILTAGSVSIEDCVIDGFKSSGINVASGRVFVRNTTIRNNVAAGITVKPGVPVGLAEVALVFNGVGIAGSARSVGNVYLFGNKTGDPA
jgi:Right handed beta helix region